ncbi:MAG: dihydroneopterin aldolase [Rickettsiales bacterium]|jgi:dihydroneopterin aldolase|nr:dihydroneopterin aldolase [Rickettsiales bacterium]
MRNTIIRIKEWRTHAIVGVHAWEQEQPRSLLLSLELTLKPGLAFTNDAIDETVDYDALTQEIAALLAERRFQLIETVAELVLGYVLKHPLVESASVEVDKPGAVTGARSISVIRASST